MACEKLCVVLREKEFCETLRDIVGVAVRVPTVRDSVLLLEGDLERPDNVRDKVPVAEKVDVGNEERVDD